MKSSGIARAVVSDTVIISVLLIIFVPLFTPGTVFVGDYVAGSQINVLSQTQNVFSAFTTSVRNGGYDYLPYILRWASAPYYLLSTLVSILSGGWEFSKLVLPIYFAIGAVGMNHLLDIGFRNVGVGFKKNQLTFVKTSCSLLYVLNPAVLQLLVKGYMATMITLALLPLFLLSYNWLASANSRMETASRAMVVSLIGFASIGYSYSLLMVGSAVICYELFLSLQRREQPLTKVLERISLVALIWILLELPTLYQVAHQSPVPYPAGWVYLAGNSSVSPLTVLTLSSASWGPSYFQQFYPIYFEIFAIGILLLLIIDLAALLSHRWDKWRVFISGLITVSILIALGPSFPPNTWLNGTFPIFPESFELIPLVALSFAFLTCVSLCPTTRLRPRAQRIFERIRFNVKPLELVLLLIIVSSLIVPWVSASSKNLSPIAIPLYDKQAYAWLAQQPGDGRIFLIPPSYANRYSFDANVYAGPVDYWTISPPKPIIIDNGGNMGGLERLLPKALYSANTRLLDFLLSSLGVKYVVLRTDIVSTWDVPNFTNITKDYLETNFPFLEPKMNFGPIAIYQNDHFYGLFDSFSYPVVVRGNTSDLPLLAQVLQPGTPVLFTDDLRQPSVQEVLTKFSSPILITHKSIEESDLGLSSSRTVLVQIPTQDSPLATINDTRWKFVDVISQPDSNLNVMIPFTVFRDDFSNSTFTLGSWAIYGEWNIGRNGLIANDSSYQPYAIVHSPSSGNFMVEAQVSIQSGFAAGITLSDNSSISRDSYQVFLIPSWHGVLLSHYLGGNGLSLEFASTRIDFNSTYNLIVSYVEHELQVWIGGQLILSSQIRDLSGTSLGLIATQAKALFPRFEVNQLLPDQSTQTSFSNFTSYPEKSISIRIPDQRRLFISAANGTIYGQFATSASIDAMQSLSPERLPTSYASDGTNSWKFTVGSASPSFLVARFVYSSNWLVPSGAGLPIQVDGYAFGFAIQTGGLVSYDNGTYTYLSFFSASVAALGFIFLLSIPISTIRRSLKPRTVVHHS